jgi:plasmid stabilization system protein ParE
MRVIYLAPASDELHATIDWFAEHATTDHAASFASAIEAAVFEIAEVPAAWPISRLSTRVRSRALGSIHHSIFYLVEPEQIVIVAIAHMKRRPGYWLDRVQ